MDRRPLVLQRNQVLSKFSSLALHRGGLFFADLVVELKFILSLRCFAQLLVRQSKAVMCLRELWVQVDCLFVRRNRLLELAPLGSHNSKLQVGFVKLGIEAHRLPEQLFDTLYFRCISRSALTPPERHRVIVISEGIPRLLARKSRQLLLRAGQGSGGALFHLSEKD